MKSGVILTTLSALSDPGLKRDNNEDSFLLADLAKGKSLADSCQVKRNLSENMLLLVVSDGVGGSQLGELASELTVLSIRDAFVRMGNSGPVTDRLTAAVEQANHVLWEENIKDGNSQWMKATATVAVVEEGRAFIATVGDSRAYIIRGGRIKQLTTDQTLAGVLVSRGMLDPEDVSKQARNNMILQAIGNAQTLQVAISAIEFEHGDFLLLCSDGLSNKVQPQELCHLVNYYSSLDAASMHMVELAKKRGGEDNITVVLAKMESDALLNKKGRPLTGEVKHLSYFDPYAETKKSRKRTELIGANSERKVSTRFPLEARGVNSVAGTFVEQSETLQLGKMDASFLLSQQVDVDDLLHISLPMPSELRLFDLNEPLYRVYAQVRKVSKQAEGKFLIRVAFISKNNPESPR
jgi:protein phosphatase